MTMHAASIERSPRLQRVRDVLSDGREHSTLEIVRDAGVCAVNSIVAELRANGLDITCRRGTRNGGAIWLYQWRRRETLDIHDGAGGGAVFSADRSHRYILTRVLAPLNLEEAGPVLFVMLNPSVADEWRDDPTLRRCMAFGRTWGHPLLLVANLYSLVATSPAGIDQAAGAVGPLCDRYLVHAVDQVAERGLVVCAWGDSFGPAGAKRAREVRDMIEVRGAVPHHIGLTRVNRRPRHPLYVRGDARPQPWNVRREA